MEIERIMIETIQEYYPKANIILMLWIFVLIAVMVDLVAGVWKAKRLDYIITSDGLKRSVSKLVMYYLLMTFFCMMDLVASASGWLQLPYISMIACFLILFIEVKSVFERADQKERKRLVNGAKDVTAILASKEDIAKAIHDYIKEKDNDTFDK